MIRLLMAPEALPSCFSCAEEHGQAMLDTVPRSAPRRDWARRLWHAARRALAASLSATRTDSAAAW